jgi:hypothetical protein
LAPCSIKRRHLEWRREGKSEQMPSSLGTVVWLCSKCHHLIYQCCLWF